MEKIILTRIVRTKNDKVMLVFLRPVSEKSVSSKGYNDNIQWLEDLEIFNKLEQSDFGRLIDANLGYSEPDFSGKCSIIIKDLLVNGKTIKL